MDEQDEVMSETTTSECIEMSLFRREHRISREAKITQWPGGIHPPIRSVNGRKSVESVQKMPFKIS